MTTSTQKPSATLRDGAIKATIWKRQSESNGSFFTVEFSRTYTDEAGAYHDSRSFSGAEPLMLARLAGRAYDRIADLRIADKQRG